MRERIENREREEGEKEEDEQERKEKEREKRETKGRVFDLDALSHRPLKPSSSPFPLSPPLPNRPGPQTSSSGPSTATTARCSPTARPTPGRRTRCSVRVLFSRKDEKKVEQVWCVCRSRVGSKIRKKLRFSHHDPPKLTLSLSDSPFPGPGARAQRDPSQRGIVQRALEQVRERTLFSPFPSLF